jgi:type VI protein secretion system component Hcp
MALFDAFLKLDGIKGESADTKHKGEIDVINFTWGVAQTGVSATGGGAGKVHVHDFTILKKTDASSPLLMLNCASGAHIKEANFVVRKAGGEQLEYLKIKLTDVLVSSYRPGIIAILIGLLKPAGQQAPKSEKRPGSAFEIEDFSFDIEQVLNIGSQSTGAGAGKVTFNPFHVQSGGDQTPVEAVTLNFAKIEFSYQPQGADGKSQGGPILAGWDVKGNVKV